MTSQQIQDWKDKIDRMTTDEKAGLFFRAPKTHPIFATEELLKYFMDRLNKLPKNSA